MDGLGCLIGSLGGLFVGASAAGTGSVGSMLDMNDDGSALDDILRMAGKASFPH